MASFIQKLDENVETTGEKLLFAYLDGKGKITEQYSYEEFATKTKVLASILLNDLKIAKGDPVLLVYPPGLDFIVTFVACLRAGKIMIQLFKTFLMASFRVSQGIVAVPVYPPHPFSKKDINMFVSVQSSCKATLALTNSFYDNAKSVAKIRNMFTTMPWPNLTWHVTNKLVSKKGAATVEAIPYPEPSTLAFLQYTSGSTSAPKGVMLTHANLAHNLSSIIQALEAGDDSIVVGWLPQYHDMGLIGSLMGIAYCGGSGYYMSPIEFIKRPPFWIESMSKYRATHVQAPNFAYKLTVRKFKAALEKPTYKPDLDLSSVKHIFNAAEPIDLDAIDLFNTTFKPYGLDEQAMSPGYGLAEHTVYVCDKGKERLIVNKESLEKNNVVEVVDERNEKSMYLAGCGDPSRLSGSNITVRIVDPDKLTEIEEGHVGEIWVTSPSKAIGYFGLETKTKEDLKAKIVSEDTSLTDLEWLRTGDLGFMYKGELFICGRIKDLVIIRGRNHFPQDIETTVEEAHKNIRPGCTAAFTILHPKGGAESLVVVAELDGKNKVQYDEVVANIKRGIAKDHGLNPYAVVLIKLKTINKTTSGKIRRHAVRKSFLEGTLKEEYHYEVRQLCNVINFVPQ